MHIEFCGAAREVTGSCHLVHVGAIPAHLRGSGRPAGAGAPADKAAGLGLCVRIGDRVRRGDVLMTVHAESPGELEYALEYFRAHPDVITLSAD